MAKIRISALKQSPYGFARKGERVDPTREGVQKAIDEGRRSKHIMGHNYEDLKAEIVEKTKHLAGMERLIEMDRLMHEYHNERIAELVLTKDTWLDKADPWPITVNQFNEIIEGNHRFRAIRHLGVDEVEVIGVEESGPRGFGSVPAIWE